MGSVHVLVDTTLIQSVIPALLAVAQSVTARLVPLALNAQPVLQVISSIQLPTNARCKLAKSLIATPVVIQAIRFVLSVILDTH